MVSFTSFIKENTNLSSGFQLSHRCLRASNAIAYLGCLIAIKDNFQTYACLCLLIFCVVVKSSNNIPLSRIDDCKND